MLKIVIQLAIYFLIAGCDHHTETVFPDAKWVEAKPERVGLESETLNEAVAFLESNSGASSIHELMIIRRGILIYRGDSIDKVHAIWSCTKSFTSTVLGLLVDDKIVPLNTLTKDILPEMSAAYPTVTLSHFRGGCPIWDLVKKERIFFFASFSSHPSIRVIMHSSTTALPYFWLRK